MRSTRRIELLRPAREERPLALEHSGRVACGLELGDVDSDRPRDDTRATVRVLDRSRDVVHSRARAARSHEAKNALRQRSVWKPTTSFASSPS